MRYLRLAERLFNHPLLISEDKLNVILRVFGKQSGVNLLGLPAGELATVSDSQRAAAGYAVLDGLGVIGVHGPLMHRVLDMEFPSGGPMTYASIRGAFDLALADDAVQGIVLDIDSPGGEANGVFDLADHIYQARAIKPITAVVNESAYSAAYLLASAAERIVIPRTGGAGSIGVIATHADFSRAEDDAGITVTHVYAGARKADFSPHRPLTDEALKVLQEAVGETYALFVDTVARNRGLSVAAVRGTEAGLFQGKKAVAAKLADQVGAVDRALTEARKGNTSRLIAVSASPEEQLMTVEELRQNHPDLVAQIETEARQGMVSLVVAEAGPAVEIIALCEGASAAFLAADAIKAGLSLDAVQARLSRVNECRDVLKAASVEPSEACLKAIAADSAADMTRHLLDCARVDGQEITSQHRGQPATEPGAKSPNHSDVYSQLRRESAAHLNARR